MFKLFKSWIVPIQPITNCYWIGTANQWRDPLDSDLSNGYLTIIPRVRMGYESIAHEAEGRMGY